jgi:HlyD family secretion protein
MKKIITIIVLIVIIAGGIYGYYFYRNQQQAAKFDDLPSESVSLGRLVAKIGATGEVRPIQSANLSWKTTGTIENVNVSVGDMVAANQELARLEETSLPQNIIMAKAELVSAKKALEDLYSLAEDAKVQSLQAIAQYAQALKSAQYQLDNFTVPSDQAELGTMEAFDLMEEKLNQARNAFEPYKYYPSGDTTRQELKDALDDAQSEYNSAVKRLEYEYNVEVAKANLENARQDFEKWKNGPDPDDVAAAEARIAAAEATVRLAWIEAPFDGTITVVNAQLGDQISTNSQTTIRSEAFRLDDLSKLLVDLQVSEVDINQIKVGQNVSLSFDAILGKEYRGIVSEVANVGIINQGLVEFTVTVELEDADEDVKPGMTAAVNIVINELENVLLVPNRAVRIRDGKKVVYVLRDEEIAPVEIELGASSETMSEVIEGDLQDGDVILLSPPTEFESNGPPFMRGG